MPGITCAGEVKQPLPFAPPALGFQLLPRAHPCSRAVTCRLLKLSLPSSKSVCWPVQCPRSDSSRMPGRCSPCTCPCWTQACSSLDTNCAAEPYCCLRKRPPSSHRRPRVSRLPALLQTACPFTPTFVYICRLVLRHQGVGMEPPYSMHASAAAAAAAPANVCHTGAQMRVAVPACAGVPCQSKQISRA